MFSTLCYLEPFCIEVRFIFIMSSSATEQHEPETTSQNTISSAIQSQEVHTDSVSPILTPVLPPDGQVLTEADYEDNLVNRMDELICNFLNRPNPQYPYHGLFRWTFDDERNLNYSVLVMINQPSDLI
jgi:hypothetical protein